jgi:hypothetical protein
LHQSQATQLRSRRTAIQSVAALFAAALTQPGLAQTTPATAPQEHGVILAQVLYLLAPNKRFTAAQYQRQAAILQQRMLSNAGLRDGLVQGMDRLNTASDKPFLQQTEDAQRDLLRKQAGTPFWVVMGNPAVGIYNNPEIWPLIGYEGPAFEKGGYLFRGVNDIAWLPQ